MYRFWTLLLTLAFFCQSAWALSEKEVYQSKKTWEETVTSTKGKLKEALTSHDFPYVSKVFRQGDKVEKISIDVAGLDKLVLITWGTEDGKRYDHSAWANAKLTTTSGKEVWLDEMDFLSAFTGAGDPIKGYTFYNKRIVIGEKEYQHGVLAHSDSEIVLDLGGKYSKFEAEIGIDDRASQQYASAVFKVQNIATSELKTYMNADFPQETNSFLSYADVGVDAWLKAEGAEIEKTALQTLLGKLADPSHFQKLMKEVGAKPQNQQAQAYLNLFSRALKVYNLQNELQWVNLESIQLAADKMKEDLIFDAAHNQHLIDKIVELYPQKDNIYNEDPKAFAAVETILKNKREVLLGNPLLDMDKIIVVRHKLADKARQVMGPGIGTQSNNWSVHLSQRKSGVDCEISELSNLRGDIKTKTLFKPTKDAPVTDLQLHWDADRLLFTSVSDDNRWQLFEIQTDGSGLKQVTNVEEPDLEFFDGTYLPSGKIIAGSNIGYQGVPCVDGADAVGNLCLYDPKTKDLRRLNFGQDNDWDPIVMDNGRVMYLRWEYTDNTHYFSRILMHMNPDGTNKKELYGSGSYWPNSMFDAQPLPGKGNEFVAIVSGHHGIARSGELVLFDPSKGRHEEKGVIQQIPHRNKKVEPLIKDLLVDGVWPQFLKPRALSKEFFLVTAKLSPESLWGLYLVDVYDNVTPIAMFEGEGITEATPVIKKETPPVIPEKVNPEDKESTLYIQDIYEGEGTKGVPRGTIKELRIFAYEFAYIKSPSNHLAQGIQSGWDMKRLLGTVPVEEDGSVMFKVPANLPISIQPLDEEGAAVQQMRSWLTGMPGEIVSCVGCHEDQNTIVKPKTTLAAKKGPQSLTPPDGGIRPFTYELEVQPLLEKRCISCHDGSNKLLNFKDNSLDEVIHFGKSYLALHPFVNRQGPEADIHVMKPMEYHANTSDLVKMLKKGHHNVDLSDEEWRTLYTWIDFNAPYTGVFKANEYKGYNQINRRQELMEKYSNLRVDWETELQDYVKKLNAKGDITPIRPEKEDPEKHKKTKLKNWPFTEMEAISLQTKAGTKTKEITLAPGITMKLVRVPAGSFIMGYENGDKDEYPRSKVAIEKAFWMGAFEVTNEQFKTLFPKHDSRYIAQFWKDHTTPGYAANKPQQPVIRVSWEEAMEFCKKLSEKTGMKISLPTEAQWEWAARAGNEQQFWYGDLHTDFSPYANLADEQLADMAVSGVDPKPMPKGARYRHYFDFIPRSKTVDDGSMLGTEVGKYKANPWGLFDITGNVSEWTRSDYKPYPYKADDGRNSGSLEAEKVVRGGSWRDRPEKATVSRRDAYKSWQKVFNVGFRIVIEE